MLPCHRSARRSPFALTVASGVAVAVLAALGAAAPGILAPIDMTGWSLFDPDDDWNFSNPTPNSVLMTEQVGSSSVHPGWVVSDLVLANEATIEFDLSVGAGTGDDDLIGFGFAWQDGSHSWLLDWKRTSQSFNWGQSVPVNDDLAEQGLKIKRIDGSYSWDGLWGGSDGAGVTTHAGPAGGAWTAGTVYHFVVELSPGHIVVTRDGVGIFDLLDPTFPGAAGAITSYGFSQNNITLANVVITSPTWIDLGQGKAGVAGVPGLAGSGGLTTGSPNALLLGGAKPLAQATLVFGLAAIEAPFKGGTLVPHPLLLVPMGTDGTGSSTLPFTLPAGVPAGLSLYFQFWIQDAAATFGLAASNGLQGVTS